ncbi:MAG: Crp/Fnr family transcriptional regulator [Clostridiales Family XIII bacterium]|jgi:CRP-like cAMP-binding protein|nr:Crp/Fnr family transcriptional regulator [Clostridiales Family XIII bacterium]
MKNIFPVISSSPLFAGISSEDFGAIMGCLGAAVKGYDKGETVYFEGDTVSEIGLLVSGKLHLLKNDIWGNNSILTEISPPDMFAEAVVCSGLGRVPVSVVAKEKSEILFIDYKKVVTTCEGACGFHSKLIRNMIGVLARKNILLSNKMEHITKRTIKDKLLSYLGDAARQTGSRSIDIPYNRQELADYLSVERSALSAEMSKLKSEGIIDYRKNHFEVLRKEDR